MIRPVLKWPDPMLSRRSLPTGPGEALDKLVADMIDTVKAEGGIGISAIQIGVPVRVFVLDVGSGPEVYLNPEWTPWKGTDEVMLDEGCLSVPSPVQGKDLKGKDRYYRALVPRFERINATWMNQRGFTTKDKMRGLRAQVFQHESEHLDGRIFLDHLDEKTRADLREKLATKG